MSTTTKPHSLRKRIVVCCDGTWLNVEGKDGAHKPSSNAARMARVVKTTCSDGTHQIIQYHPGLGSSGRLFDSSIGGTFGLGLSENIRELYDFVCTNYVDGDEIILVGFSRGAFTARSLADLIASIGMLTMDGFDHFYDIFEDYENMGDDKRSADKFLYSELTPYKGEKGQARIQWENNRKTQYRTWLKKMNYTRDTYLDGSTEITVKAVGVWETFTNTQVSEKVENAFQALGLDEPRYDFRPALWEKPNGSRTNLKQVWFPGSHSNIGGGLPDQQISNIAFAWMCDQLSTLGVEFEYSRMSAIFMNGLRYGAAHPFPHIPSHLPIPIPDFLQPHPHPIPWASKGVFPTSEADRKRDTADCDGKDHHPTGPPAELWKTARSWGLGQTRFPSNWLQVAVGTIVRRPGLFMRVDPQTNEYTDEPLLNTNERIHSCVRVRLASGGLSMDDKEVWKCEGLCEAPDDSEAGSSKYWKLGKTSGSAIDEAEKKMRELQVAGLAGYPQDGLYPLAKLEAEGWRWVFQGPVAKTGAQQVPQVAVLPEEPLVGYWERLLLGLTVGNPDIWTFAEKVDLAG